MVAADARRKLELSRALVLGALLALIGLGLVWELWLAPTGARSLALKVLPLAFTVAGVAKLRLQTYRVLSLLVWLYVAEGAMRMASSAGIVVWLAGAELALCALLFIGCVMQVRSRAGLAAEAAA